MHQLFTTCVKQTHTQNEPREEGKCTEFCHGSQRRKRKACGPEFYLKIEVISNQFTGKKKFHFSRVPAEQSPTASAGLETKIAIRIITVVTVCVLHSEHARCFIHRPLLLLLLPLPLLHLLHSVWLVLHCASQRMELPLFSRNHSCQQTCANKPAAFTNICTRYTGPGLTPRMMAGTFAFTLCALQSSGSVMAL